MARSNSEPTVDCELCQHFRPQTSFVDAWKRFDDSGPRKEVMQSLKEVRQAETETLENEVELLFELVRTETTEWPNPPRFAPYCGLGDELRVAALVNQAGRCRDFELAIGREQRACHTCMFCEQPIRTIGDRSTTPASTGGLRNEVFDRMMQIDKEMKDADAAAQGLEIEQSFFGDGRLPVVKFLPTCGARRTDGRSHVVPFCNLRRDCDDHSPWLPVPPGLLPGKNDAEHADPQALALTLDLIRQVATSGARNPGGFLDGLLRWIGQDPRHIGCVEWARRGLSRWAGLVGFDATAIGRLPEPSISAQRLVPFIAGVDAFEWGWLAESSHGNAFAVANAIVQQVAEFLAGTVRPLEAVRCIESITALLASAGFSADTLAVIDPFLRRLRVVGKDVLHAKRTDLAAYHELQAAALLYSVAKWLRAKPITDSGASAIVGDAFARGLRDRAVQKCSEARRQGMILLARLSVLENPDAQPLPGQFLEQLTRLNEEALATDVREMKDLFHQAMKPLEALGGGASQPQAQLASMFGLGDLAVDPVEQAIEQMFDPVRRSELPRRHLAAWLLLRRGTLAVTPSAIDFQPDGKPAMSTPQSLEQALLEPASRNVEGYFPPPGVDPILAACRRIGSPRMVDAATASTGAGGA